MAQMKEKTFRKRTKQNGDKQSIRCRVQNTGYYNARGTHWVLQQHRKTQAEMVTLRGIKKNLQGTNSGVDEADNEINDLEHKEEEKHSIRTTRRKKESKEQG